MKEPIVSNEMNTLLRKIANFVGRMQISPFSEGYKRFSQWNEGVATAAMHVLDNNDNQELRAAIDEYVRISIK